MGCFSRSTSVADEVYAGGIFKLALIEYVFTNVERKRNISIWVVGKLMQEVNGTREMLASHSRTTDPSYVIKRARQRDMDDEIARPNKPSKKTPGLFGQLGLRSIRQACI
jgi:hypothetical protein